MKYVLDEEEYTKLKERANSSATLEDVAKLQKELIQDLRKKVMELGEFRCFHDLSDEELGSEYVDEGYCDRCPLSFCENEGKKANHRMCGHSSKLYSK